MKLSQLGYSWPRPFAIHKANSQQEAGHTASVGAERGLEFIPIQALSPKLDIVGGEKKRKISSNEAFFAPRHLFIQRLNITIFSYLEGQLLPQKCAHIGPNHYHHEDCCMSVLFRKESFSNFSTVGHTQRRQWYPGHGEFLNSTPKRMSF